MSLRHGRRMTFPLWHLQDLELLRDTHGASPMKSCFVLISLCSAKPGICSFGGDVGRMCWRVMFDASGSARHHYCLWGDPRGDFLIPSSFCTHAGNWAQPALGILPCLMWGIIYHLLQRQGFPEKNPPLFSGKTMNRAGYQEIHLIVFNCVKKICFCSDRGRDLSGIWSKWVLLIWRKNKYTCLK